MARDVYEETKTHTTYWDDELEAVVHKWNNYAKGEQFREGAEAMIECTKEHGGSKILIDHRDMTGVNRDDHEYLLEDWIPRAVDAGAEYHMVVHEQSTIAEMNLDDVVDAGDVDYTSDMTSDMDEARKWIASK
ncbi:hypothetical protein D8Y22_02815 [Salinadaptatus halalkaliphilus]|uniref:STAS/SEC14 domain-containing protein n=1 Tax=Salinadaptatus halalkaliphilus TaxID=2419781 RepID=A0A4S3TS76_9EURY|nr:hypothetical protein [Salinadaptatus halalkaliphilus]THE66225.1 hypothetical protein D8Y22_02815 [Salinadaptatus halalkaliphilus]